MDKPKYIKNAIIWNRCAGDHGAWLRISDMNLVKECNDEYYMYAPSGRPKFIARTVYPYKRWMEKYIGTDNDLRKDKNFKYGY